MEPMGIEAHPEGMYAENTRADIRVMANPDIAIPIEIKRDTHRDIWRAINEQLVAKYTRAPESEGYGIYLAFWFGPTQAKKIPKPPHGKRPKTPAEFRKLLEEMIPRSLRGRIKVVTVDVSPPDTYVAGSGSSK